MQQFTPVLAAFGGAIVVLAGYHFFVNAPRLRRLAEALQAHDLLLGGGVEPATRRLAEIDEHLAAGDGRLSLLNGKVDALERVARAQTPRIGFLRYNAFDDVGSDLSYALALVTSEGDGVVLSSIYSREETRTYGKSVTGFQTAVEASSEEMAAIAKARAAAS